MKIRTDFVTNSSSSSFVLDIIVETEDERWHTLYRHFKLQGDYLDDLDRYDIDEDGEIIESDENPSEDGSYDGAIDFYFQLLKEISRGKTYYRGKKVNSIIKRTVVEGFDEGGADETYELGDKLKAKYNNGDDFELDEKSIEKFEKFLHDRWDGFLVEEEKTSIDGETSSWYSFDYSLFEYPYPRGIKKRSNILTSKNDSQMIDEIKIEQIPCRNTDVDYDPKLEDIVSLIKEHSKDVVSQLKSGSPLLIKPQILKTLILESGYSKVGNLWKNIDFSLYNPVRVALYCMINGIRLIDEFEPRVIKKATVLYDKYFKNDTNRTNKLYYHLLNNLSLVNIFKKYFGIYSDRLDAYIDKDV